MTPLVRRVARPSLLWLFSLLGCGGAPESQGSLAASIRLNGIVGYQRIELRVFGSAANCAMFWNDPAKGATQKTCAAGERETATDCHLAYAYLGEPGTTQMGSVPAGSGRVLWVAALASDRSVVGSGCTEGFTVKDGRDTEVKVSLK